LGSQKHKCNQNRQNRPGFRRFPCYGPWPDPQPDVLRKS
jgi:hypothetical protein